MKHLQNNFTTPGQSKRLLELGIPADSADCFYYETDWSINHNPTPLVISPDLKYNQLDLRDTEVSLPCWSVGRLIEILKLCLTDYSAKHEILNEFEMDINIIPSLIQTLIQAYSEYINIIDFSKLEE